ncbi:hypothetical protein NHH03_22620 [Stieleria sp. TO1_6]|uniref:hypothetical protein n=1 Tax=Stieleria tagensis TaxID=2956795 RepID=UPI00209B7B02|nr:hypothetical protein [Stieleria tagensis]MCO8124551.1 hypothetical protein [Stieleria tagensis]
MERQNRPAATTLIACIGLPRSTYHTGKDRYGKPNDHNGKIPRDWWLADWEKQAIVDFHDAHPLEGYRRLTYMMMDGDIVAASLATVFRVLSEARRMGKCSLSNLVSPAFPKWEGTLLTVAQRSLTGVATMFEWQGIRLRSENGETIVVNRVFLFYLTICASSWFTQSFGEERPSAEPSVAMLLQKFKDYSGAELVFDRNDLPEGRYHDVLKPLSDSRKKLAAEICNEEARMYPPGYFGEVGLKAVGIFEACVSKSTSDRSRPYDSQLGGYRFFGIYNGVNAIAAAFYSEGQLALTFHHEVFHHVDSTVDGETGSWNLSTDDAFYQAAISGLRPYASPPIANLDLSAIRERCIGFTLQDSVSEYAAKNSREDQAETARHIMSMLPSSLVQIIDQPELAGSQRIIHVLGEYEKSVPDGPGLDWFVDVALDRARRDVQSETVEQLLIRLRAYADGGASGFEGVAEDPQGARDTLKKVVRLKPETVPPNVEVELVELASDITSALLQQRIRPDASNTRFRIWGSEDSQGVNRTLRRDVVQFAADAKRLKLISSIHLPASDKLVEHLKRSHLHNLRQIAAYFVFIDANWTMTPGTHDVFESTKKSILQCFQGSDVDLIDKLHTMDFRELADPNTNIDPL